MKIKMCGIRRKEDIDYVNVCCPDYVGFVFAKSKRKVSAKEAKELISMLDSKIQSVGVFVNEPLESLQNIINETKIDVVQLHGDETKAYVESLKKMTNAKIWKAFRIDSKKQLEDAREYEVDRYLFDSFSRDCYGGTGKKINLKLFENEKIEKPFFLAGGFTPENINEELLEIHPYGIDISSGIETNGWKDFEKMKQVMKQIRRIS